jgi:hypothetical protein
MKLIVLLFWVAVIIALLYIYFYQPWIFYRIFYSLNGGGGGPFVNTPRG